MVRESKAQGERKKEREHLLKERVEEDDGLDGFAEAHFVGQNGVGALSPREAKPVETLQLVQVQRPAR